MTKIEKAQNTIDAINELCRSCSHMSVLSCACCALHQTSYGLQYYLQQQKNKVGKKVVV